MELTILYEDDYLVAVDKPSGLLVHPSWISPADEPNMMGLLKSQLNAEKLHTIHRLDRGTSGVILVGKEVESSKLLQAQFQERGVQKVYECVVRGWVLEGAELDYPLVPKKDKFADPFASEDKEAKEAVTIYEPLDRIELDIPVGRYPQSRYSRVRCKPKTGRKHQIRRHMKHILHPIIGDTKYGEGRHNRMFRETLECHRMLLMARSIEFNHPITNQRLNIESPLPIEVVDLYHKFNWSV